MASNDHDDSPNKSSSSSSFSALSPISGDHPSPDVIDNAVTDDTNTESTVGGGIGGGEGCFTGNVTLPTPVLVTVGGGDGEGSGGSSAVGGGLTVKKGGDDRALLASSSGGSKPLKRRAEILDPPQGPPSCRVCGKEFTTWKAVFGHMRLHPERTWRGSFPPPFPSPPPSPIREQVVNQQEPQGPFGGVMIPRVEDLPARGVEIDLNIEPTDEASAETVSGAERDDSDVERKGLDLNMPPPPPS
ncbi:Zinc finger protein [Quillaja saponaria]|uniref:Zinc finger protein n=1 Tax=Quillaja saponaria TaxID=32244 RepID=A0AAD7PFJ6_QUISA|nr:Zinc finger protein [Quillaja saponaria]